MTSMNGMPQCKALFSSRFRRFLSRWAIPFTHRIVKDYFPERDIAVKKISLTFSIMNPINSFFSGIPVCHGSGGVAEHVTFAARTGGSVVMYGMLYLMVGLFFSHDFNSIFLLFPKPVLAVSCCSKEQH